MQCKITGIIACWGRDSTAVRLAVGRLAVAEPLQVQVWLPAATVRRGQSSGEPNSSHLSKRFTITPLINYLLP